MTELMVVLRSAGERTEEACLQIIRTQIGFESQVHVVRDKPFADAHIESMRLAVEADAKWSIFLDADVLLRKDVLIQMVIEAESIAQAFYMLNFQILDRGFGGPAYGVHLYTTRHLSTALQFEDLAREAQRPESHLCQEMARRAQIPSLLSTTLVGLHGYEQFYEDLYRTTFVRAIKFASIQNVLMKRYRGLYDLEGKLAWEYRVMFWGLIDGILYAADHEKAILDKHFYEEQASRVFSVLGLEEKGSFILVQEEMERLFQQSIPDEYYLAIRNKVCPSGSVLAAPPDRSLRKMARKTFYSFGRRIKRVTLAIVGR